MNCIMSCEKEVLKELSTYCQYWSRHCPNLCAILALSQFPSHEIPSQGTQTYILEVARPVAFAFAPRISLAMHRDTLLMLDAS